MGITPRGTRSGGGRGLHPLEYEKWKKVIVEGKIKSGENAVGPTHSNPISPR